MSQNELRDTLDELEAAVIMLRDWKRAYPLDLFPEPDPADLAWLHETKPGLCDRISASMGRHMVSHMEEVADAAQSIGESIARRLEGDDNEWTPSEADYDRSIHANPDANAWADFFVATYPGLADKHDVMRGWFANAMMAMHDHLHGGGPINGDHAEYMLASAPSTKDDET